MPFDVEQFLHVELSKPMSTEYPVIPEGEYRLIIKKHSLVKNRSKESGDEFLSLNLDMEVDDDRVREATQMEHPSVRYSFIIDLFTDPQGRTSIDEREKKNIKLGRLREAIGRNDKAFQFSMLDGQVVMGQVKNKPGEDGQIYNNVTAVRKL